MEIPKEGIVLGSDDDCDLIIFDPHLAPRHLRILPQKGGVLILTPLEGEVSLDGLPIKEDTVLKSPAQVITAGETHFVAGIADQEWPEVVIPESKGSHLSDEQLSVELTASDAAAAGEEKGRNEKKKNILPNILIGGGAIILVGTGAFFAYGLVAKKLKNPAPQPAVLVTSTSSQKSSSFWEKILPKRSSQVETESAQSPIDSGKAATLQWSRALPEVRITQELFEKVPGIVFSINAETSRKQFSVWVRGETAATLARRILDRASPPVAYQLIDLSQLETSAMTLAQVYGMALRLRVEPEGIAFWSGYLKDDKNWRNFFPHISQDLPGIRDNRSEIIFGSILLPKLLQELREQGFSTEIRPVAAEDGIRLEGFLPKEQSEKWKSWMTQLRTRYASLAFISDQVTSKVPRTDVALKEFFPSQVIGIAGSIMPWVSLADGTKLFPGARLKKGYTLEAITAESLQLSGPEGSLKFSLSRLN